MSNVKASTALVAGLLLLVAAPSCGAPRHRKGSSPEITDAGRDTEKTVGDPDLNKRLEIHNVRSRRVADQRLQVEFELYNKMSYGVEFQWAVYWFDASGFRIEAPLLFELGHLAKRGSQTITVTAPNAQATGWQLCLEKPGR